MLKVDKVSLNCQKSSISNQKLSFATLKTLCSLHEPIISFVSQQLHYKKGHNLRNDSCLVTIFFTIVKLLALALTNLVLDLANLVTNLAKPSLD